MARLCARMEAAGHVVQKRATRDRRSRLIELTAGGAGLAARIEEASLTRFSTLIERIPGQDRQPLLDALAVLNAAVLALRTTEGDSP